MGQQMLLRFALNVKIAKKHFRYVQIFTNIDSILKTKKSAILHLERVYRIIDAHGLKIQGRG